SAMQNVVKTRKHVYQIEVAGTKSHHFRTRCDTRKFAVRGRPRTRNDSSYKSPMSRYRISIRTPLHRRRKDKPGRNALQVRKPYVPHHLARKVRMVCVDTGVKNCHRHAASGNCKPGVLRSDLTISGDSLGLGPFKIRIAVKRQRPV